MLLLLCRAPFLVNSTKSVSVYTKIEQIRNREERGGGQPSHPIYNNKNQSNKTKEEETTKKEKGKGKQ